MSLRAGVGWRGRLCWGAAFGVVEAALIDQSLFNPGYRDIAYWQDMVGPTWIPGLGLGLSTAFGFVVGHMIFSIGIPLVVVESVHPSVRGRTWLGRVALVITAAAYLAASYFVLDWTHGTETFRPSTTQLIGAAAVAVMLIVAGLVLGRRTLRPLTGGTPSRWLFGLGAFVAVFAFDLSTSWLGTLLGIVVLVATLVAHSRFSRTSGWSVHHLVLAAGGAMLCRAGQGFWVDPIGDGARAAQYAHNTVAVLLVIVLVAIGWWRNRESLVRADQSVSVGHLGP